MNGDLQIHRKRKRRSKNDWVLWLCQLAFALALVRTRKVELSEDHDSGLGVNEDRAVARPSRVELRENSELVSQKVADDE
ncbi:hypothetical protein ACFX13_021888 [Malus domestica]